MIHSHYFLFLHNLWNSFCGEARDFVFNCIFHFGCRKTTLAYSREAYHATVDSYFCDTWTCSSSHSLSYYTQMTVCSWKCSDQFFHWKFSVFSKINLNDKLICFLAQDDKSCLYLSVLLCEVITLESGDMKFCSLLCFSVSNILCPVRSIWIFSYDNNQKRFKSSKNVQNNIYLYLKK